VRTFLRLEHLFNIVQYHIANTNEWDNRAAITGLLNIVDQLSRSDIKADIIKELERYAATLNTLGNNPNVDQNRLHNILDNIVAMLESLKKISYQSGLNMRQDEFINSIKQRSSIPGGSCNFDLPNYHYWLHKTVQERMFDLNHWKSDLQLVHDGINLVLHMIRNSANPTMERAITGFFQKPIESDTACQLIRIILPVAVKCFPEISGSKHRITVRFLEQTSTKSRPVQIQEDMDFELHCCIM
jgi:Uncharacterized protein conserved in bacteria